MKEARFYHLPHPRLRMPRNRSACMWHLLDLVIRGHRYHTSGYISDVRKVPAFVEKMHERFGVLLSPSGKRKRQLKGLSTAHLAMYRDWDGVWLWWLLLGGDKSKVLSLADQHRETLHDAASSNGRLMFRDEYSLRIRQRTREAGGGQAWTWFMTKSSVNRIEKELVALASAHGEARERTDNLEQADGRLRQKPMFGGVRKQARTILIRVLKAWKNTHASDREVPHCVTDPLPWFNGRMKIYSD